MARGVVERMPREERVLRKSGAEVADAVPVQFRASGGRNGARKLSVRSYSVLPRGTGEELGLSPYSRLDSTSTDPTRNRMAQAQRWRGSALGIGREGDPDVAKTKQNERNGVGSSQRKTVFVGGGGRSLVGCRSPLPAL